MAQGHCSYAAKQCGAVVPVVDWPDDVPRLSGAAVRPQGGSCELDLRKAAGQRPNTNASAETRRAQCAPRAGQEAARSQLLLLVSGPGRGPALAFPFTAWGALVVPWGVRSGEGGVEQGFSRSVGLGRLPTRPG